MSDKLKPCPFCGGVPYVNQSIKYHDDETGEIERHINCNNCEIGMPETVWNRRQEARPLTVEQIEKTIYNAHMELGYREDTFTAYAEAIHRAMGGQE